MATTEEYSGASSVNVSGDTPATHNDFTYQITAVNGTLANGLIMYSASYGDGNSACLNIAGDSSNKVTEFKITRNGGGSFDAASLWISSVGDGFTLAGYSGGSATGQSQNIDASQYGAVSLSFSNVDELRFSGTEMIIDIDTFNYTLTAANSPPEASDFTASPLYQNTAHVFSLSDFGYSDDDGDVLAHLQIGTVPANGSLWVDENKNGSIDGGEAALTNGATVATVAKQDIDDGKFSYLNTDGSSSSFAYKVYDGTEYSASSYTATLTVTAEPTIILSLDPASAIGENSGVTNIKATRSHGFDKDITVALSFSGTATGGGTDYTVASSIVIPSAAENASISITAVNDGKDEADETIVVDVDSVTNGAENGTQQVTVTITDDDDPPTVSFTSQSQSSTDESGSLTITAELSAVSGKAVSVPFAVNGSSTATGGGTDYTISASPIVISAGSTTGSITITITGDALYEADETVIVEMGTPVNAVTGSSTTHTATLTDDDNPPSVSFSSLSQSSINESGTLTITAELSAVSGKAVSVPFTVNGSSTATGGGTDYTISASPIVISAGSTTGSITITITDDALDEADETVIVDMGTPVHAVTGSTTTHTATLTDDDNPPSVSFTSQSQSSTNESGTLTITAELSAASGKAVSVPFTVNGSSTATGGGTDYTISASPIVISAGSTTGSITITITGDALDEADETVVVDMGTPVNAVTGSTTTHTATITDDDNPPSVSFTSLSQSSTNESGTLTITAELSAVSGKAVSVPFTVNGSSTATGGGTDYTISASPIVISAGSTTGSITITITGDALDEADETVVVDMGTPVHAVTGSTPTHTATITDDDDSPTVTFTSLSQSSTDESGTLTITAELSAVSGKAVSVPFTVNGSSTATGGGTDYTISASPITIPAGSTTGSITITITDDALDEADETVVVDMGTPVHAVTGSTTTHTATLTDDDNPPSVSFTSQSQSSTDESGTLTITAELSAVSGKAVSVPFMVNGSSTATGNSADYGITASPIAIPAGGTTASITIFITEDALDEADETVIVDMGTPVHAVTGSTTTHTATLTDDDNPPTVSFTSQSQASTNESGTLTITAELTAASGKAVTIPFTVNGSSTATGGGTDYTILASPITILSGTTTGSITITITGDALDEADETVVVDMGTPVNAALGSTTTHTATITDDDLSPVVSEGFIEMAGATGTGGVYKAGDVLVVTWDNTAGGDNNPGTIATVVVDFSAFGGGSGVSASESAGIWTASYTISSGTRDAVDQNVTLTVTDTAGNATTVADTANAAIDNQIPVVTDSAIGISGATGTFKVGDVVTATWNNTAGGDNIPDIASVTVDFSEFGGGSAVGATNSQDTWTAEFTITEDGGGVIESDGKGVRLTATDDAGNQTTIRDGATFRVDNHSPGTLTGTLSLSEAADAGTGAGTLVATEAVTFAMVADAQTRFTIGAATGVVIFSGAAPLDYETANRHSITVRATDTAGNASESVLFVTVTDANDPPVLDLHAGDPETVDYAADHVAGGAATPLANGDATLTDPDTDALITRLQATFAATPDGTAEKISLTASATRVAADAGLVTEYDTQTRRYTVTGSARTSVYQTVLRGLVYTNENTAATATTGDRTVTIFVRDESTDSNTATAIVSVKKGPVFDLNGGEAGEDRRVSFVESSGSGSPLVAEDATLQDDDSAHLVQVEIVLTNPQDGSDERIRVGIREHGDMVSGITVSYPGEDRILLTGTALAATYLALVREVVYENLSDDPTALPDRTVTFTGQDAEGNTGIHATATISVTPQNDPPLLGTNTGLTVAEGQTAWLTTAHLEEADPDDDGMDLLFTLALPPAAGLLWEDANANRIREAGEVLGADGTFTQLSIDMGRIAYTHGGEETPSDAFVFTLADGGENGAAPLTDQRFAITVTPENDAPVITDLDGDSLTYTIRSSAVALDQGAKAGITDPDSPDFTGGILLVTIAENEVAQEDLLVVPHGGDGAGDIGRRDTEVLYEGQVIGTVTGGRNGEALSISFTDGAGHGAVNALLRVVSYENSRQDAVTESERTVCLSLTDGDGGISAVQDVTVMVEDNTPPLSEDASVTLTEDESHSFGVSDFPFTDGNPEDVLTEVVIVSLPDRGDLFLSGAPVRAGDRIGAGDIAGGLFDFRPDENGNGSSYTSFAFAVADWKDTSATHTMSLNVTAVDDGPKVAAPVSDITVTEDDSPRDVDLSGTFMDPEGDPVTLAVTGNTGSDIVGASLSGTTLSLTFAANANGSSVITVTGTAGGKTVSDSFVVTVTAVDDPPVVVSSIQDVTVKEDAAPVTVVLSAVFSDIDDAMSLSVTGNTDPLLVATKITEDRLVLTFTENSSGTSRITITATGGEETVADTFSVTVTPLPRYTLTVSVSGPGTVVSTPDGIDCGAGCTAIFKEGTGITLHAVADEEALFTGWGGEGNCDTQTACSFEMQADQKVTARFVADPNEADLAVSKTVDAFRPTQGDTVTFGIRVKNLGPKPAGKIQVTDRLPAGLTHLSDTGGGRYDPASGIWSIESLGVGASATLSIATRLDRTGEIVNTAELAGAGLPDPVTENNRATVSINGSAQQADLSVDMETAPDPASVGTPLISVITVANNGPDAANDVVLSGEMDSALRDLAFAQAGSATFVSWPPEGSIAIGALAAGESTMVRLRGIVGARPETGRLRHSVAVSSFLADANQGNNTAADTVFVAASLPVADCGINSRFVPETAKVGDTVDLTVTVTNGGPDTAPSVTVDEHLPSGLVYVSDDGNGSFDASTGTWLAGSVPSGETVSLSITTKLARAGHMRNTALISQSGAVDGNPANDSSTVALMGSAGNGGGGEGGSQTDPAIGTLVTGLDGANPGLLTPGERVQVDVDLSNNGSGSASGVRVQVQVPSGMKVETAIPDTGCYDPATNIWHVEDASACGEDGANRFRSLFAAASGPRLVLKMQVEDSESLRTEPFSAAIVAVNEEDPDLTNNMAAEVFGNESAFVCDLSVQMDADFTDAGVGEEVRITCRVRNTGPDTAGGVQVKAELPPELAYVSATPFKGAYRRETGIWTVGSLASGELALLEIRTRAEVVTDAASAHLAVVNAGGEDPIEVNNRATAAVRISDMYTVRFIPDGFGRIEGEGVQSVAPGGDCTEVTAISDSGYAFATWTGDLVTEDNPLLVEGVGRDLTIHARFIATEDRDGDGINDAEEMGPDGTDAAYDGNGDGIEDSNQAEVAAFPTADRRHYLVLAAETGIVLDNIRVTPEPAATLAEGESCPFGMMAFHLSGLAAGGRTVVTLILPDGEDVDGYCNVGPHGNEADGGYGFSYDEETGVGVKILDGRLALHFVDGGAGDYDGMKNGEILTRGGPVRVAAGSVAENRHAKLDGSGNPVCFITTLTNRAPLQTVPFWFVLAGIALVLCREWGRRLRR